MPESSTQASKRPREDDLLYELNLPEREILKNRSEVVAVDRPLAVQVAQPLFSAGLRTAGITEKTSYNPSSTKKVERLPMHVFTLLLQGELGMEVGDKTVWLEPGDLVYNPPESPYRRIGKPDTPVWFIYIDFFDTVEWESLKTKGPFHKHYRSAPLLFHLLRSILDTHRSRQSIRSARAHAYSLLELIRDEIPNPSAPPRFRRKDLEKLLETIRQNPEHSWNISKMAEALHVSRATLNRLFLSEYGMPPRSMIISLRMSLACELLANTDTTVSNIASRVGYESAFTFSNLFLKQTGLRPGAFRKRHQTVNTENDVTQ